ncbi:Protein of unknown function [Streptomyces sp. SolWspMP-sol7th]|uniref:DUF742 domain-containing protein n=1 Tax=Streptomyces sp. SolWspMP-sol7th TaxID=1839776 RepID=UPI00081ED6C9|nr:DUF742 domain-containing protein [Streptomyces sp. SolWspMP-sol7th]SCD34163.1 Protein of unknown function [Streptomyces sp. SolWspMP-sol7th]
MTPPRRRLVPDYVATAGLEVPTRIGVERTTLLHAEPGARTEGLDAAARRLLSLVEDEGTLSVYECAAQLGLPYAVVRMMAAALAASGAVMTREPPAPAHAPRPRTPGCGAPWPPCPLTWPPRPASRLPNPASRLPRDRRPNCRSR